VKPHRDANELAARLGAAANRPVPLPEAPQPTIALVSTIPQEKPSPNPTTTPKAKRAKASTDTVATTLRPSSALLNRYTLAAAERTREVGRVVSAQEIMIEVLERGP
jgi:hypothetical protein